MGFKIVTNVADEIATAEVAPDRIVVADPGFVYEGRPWQARQNPLLMPPWGLETEREIHYGRLEAAKMFAAANRLNRITLPTPDAWLGIAAPGKTYYDLREALAELGLDDAALRQYGIRLLKIEMLFPMEPGTMREFARGLEELLVVEEKRAFCELFIRDILYNQAERPRVVGKRDEEGRPLVPADGELDADRIAQIVAARLERRIQLESITARVALLEALRQRPAPLTLTRPAVLLLGLSAQPLDGAARGLDGRRRDRLPRDGAPDGPQRTMGLTHMGGEGVAVGGHGALHGDAAPLPEPRRRHVLPLRLAGHPPGRRGGRQHHLQDPLQLGGRDDRRSGRRRRHAGARADARRSRPRASSASS